MARVVQS